MGRKEDLLNPPWVYGPSDVMKSINTKYPSHGRKTRPKLTREIRFRIRDEAQPKVLVKELVRLLKRFNYAPRDVDAKDLVDGVVEGAVEFTAAGPGKRHCTVKVKHQEGKDEYFVSIQAHPGLNLRGMDKPLQRFQKKLPVKSFHWK